jgi:O-antigen ligase
MNHNRLISYKFARRKEIYIFPLLVLLVIYCTHAIIAYPFPESLLLLFIPLALIVFLICDMRLGIGLWYFASVLGNNLEIDLPGVPPLRPVHLGLFLLLAAWFVKSHREFFSTLIQFLRTTKNRTLLILIGWITLSMVMAQLEGITQNTFKYQFNAWLSVVLIILLSLIISKNMDVQFFKRIVWLIVAFDTASTLFVISLGLTKGVGLTGFKAFDQLERSAIVFWMYQPPLLLAMVFFQQQRWWGKILFSIAIVVSIVYFLLMIASGHRSSALWLISVLAFFILFTFTKGRWFMIFALVIVFPFVALNTSPIQSWIADQTEHIISPSGLAVGKGSRILLAEDAIEIIKRSPLWGTGSDRYRLHSGLKLMFRDGIIKPVDTAHNSWLQVAADSGIPALLLLVAFCGYAFRDAWRLLHSLPNGLPQRYAVFFLCTLCVAIVNSFFSSGQILPVFTGIEGGEASIVAGVLLNFWFYYGLLLGFEDKHSSHTNIKILGVA